MEDGSHSAVLCGRTVDPSFPLPRSVPPAAATGPRVSVAGRRGQIPAVPEMHAGSRDYNERSVTSR